VESRVRHFTRVLGRHFGLTSEQAADISQDVMLRLQSAEMLRRLRLAGSPEGYLYVAVRNLTLDAARKHSRETRLRLALSEAIPAEDSLEARDHVALYSVREKLSRLSREERELLRLRFWDNLSIAEIARRKQAPYSRVAVRLFRLLRRFRDGS
jgi:RNA polymerase sigma-70 factor (ECF subfamily)